MGQVVLFRGTEVAVAGNLPQLAGKAPDFTLINKELKGVACASYLGKKKVLATVPSIDTEGCALTPYIS